MHNNLTIVKIEKHDVIVPLRAPLQSGGGGQRLRSDFPTIPIDERETGGGMPGHAMERTIIEVHTDEGIVGLGECSPSATGSFDRLVGQDPFLLENVHLLYPGMENQMWVAAEMACLDIQGKALGVPVFRLLNGDDVRPRVPHSAYCFFRLPNAEEEGGVNPRNYIYHCEKLMETFGFSCLKLKMGVYHPDIEVELVQELRHVVGPSVAIRLDSQGVWSKSTAVRAMKKLESADLEYLEDPLQTTHQHAIHDYRGMADLRRRFQTPLAVDGNYRIRNLVEVIRYDCADVILGDIYGCNGLEGSRQFFYIARNMNLALSMHSGYEIGVATAARAHLAASVPGLHHPIDTHYHQLSDDVLAGGMLPIKAGCIALGEEPGLGIGLDPDKIDRYRWTQEKHDENQRVFEELHKRYEKKVEDTWFFDHGQYPQW